MQESQPAFGAGASVRVRGATWRVVDSWSFAGCTLVTLDGDSAANHGVRRTLLHPFDRFEPAVIRRGTSVVRRRRWMHAFRSLAAGVVEHGRLAAAAGARIDLLPHQLEPALAFLRGQATRVLLADEVGLGKTIQAGLILAELLARGALARALLVVPAGLRDQWAEELRTRFRLDVAVVDAPWLRRATFALPAGLNPWATVPVAITSFDFVKRAEVVRALEPFIWDLLIVDEAHAAASASGRGDAVRALAARARRVVLVTATPHAGDPVDFRALCDIGRLQSDDPVVLFRRSRAETTAVNPWPVGRRAAAPCGGPRTTTAGRRRVRILRVERSAAERQMQSLLDDYTRRAWDEGGQARPEDGQAGPPARLALVVLQKRALSSAAALARSVARRRQGLAPDTVADLEQLSLPLAGEGENDPADDEPAGVLSEPALRDAGLERGLLDRIQAAAVVASDRETKFAALERLLRRVQEPAIVFTEYRDTALRVASRLSASRRVAVLHGGLGRSERSAAERAFTGGPANLLVATDVGSEGLNLQASCRLVVSLELPWNPMRIEQRIGRVDRIGQRRTVHAVHLVAAGTGEEEVLARLAARLDRARRAIGGLRDVLGLPLAARVEESMVTGVPLSFPKESRSAFDEAGGLASTVAPAASLRRDGEVEALRTAWARALGQGPQRRPSTRAPARRPPAATRDALACALRLQHVRAAWPCGASLGTTDVEPVIPSAGLLCIHRLLLVTERGGLAEDLLAPVFVVAPTERCRTAGEVRRWLRSCQPILRDAASAASAFAANRIQAASAARQAADGLLARRDQAIARRIDRDLGHLARPIQVGLFDRRAERGRAAASRLKADLEEQLERPGADMVAVTLAGDPELALVLVVTP